MFFEPHNHIDIAENTHIESYIRPYGTMFLMWLKSLSTDGIRGGALRFAPGRPATQFNQEIPIATCLPAGTVGTGKIRKQI